MNRYRRSWLSAFALLSSFFIVSSTHALAATTLLAPEEAQWLASRNDTIVVYPEANTPPYSYQTSAGSIQGLAIDYLQLIAEKVDANLQYLTPRAHSQVLDDVAAGKGDVAVVVSSNRTDRDDLLFTDSYLSTPAVIVVRKDFDGDKTLTLSDLAGKRVAVVKSSGAEQYMRANYPRVVIESVTEDEVGLQKVVLADVDAAVMDVATLSFLLSKQILSSVQVAGNTGYEYELSFAVPKNKAVLQSIIDKGLTQVSVADREALAEKWLALPGGSLQHRTFLSRLQSRNAVLIVYVLFALSIIGIIILAVHRKRLRLPQFYRRRSSIKKLETELSELEGASEAVAEELAEIKGMQQGIKEKIDTLEG